jgi:dTDP-4-amino-4,6-dideoxygalactose transaminase
MQNTPRVKYVDLPAQVRPLRSELLAAVAQVLDDGDFILGKSVGEFECRFAGLCKTKYAFGVANGTDALVMALKALGIGAGDEVITVSNSFLATAASIALVGAKPVFVDVRDDYNIDPALIERAVTPRTKAIIPVHLTGKPADMQPIMEVAHKRKLHVIEDAAQAVGAEYHGKRVGSFGIINCFSLHPLKNLNACGDAGVMTTNDDALADKLRKMRNHGLRNRDESEFFAYNSRLDSIQAAILNVKFGHLERWTEARRVNAAFYREQLKDVVWCPSDAPHEKQVFHTFVIQAERRDELQKFLLEQGVETKIHYPIPIHLMPAAQGLGCKRGDLPVTERLAQTILSLPIYPELTTEQKEWVVAAIRTFYGK